MTTFSEIVLGNKVRYTDKDLGLIRRAKGWWMISVPFMGQATSLRFEGSNRFGPNRHALKTWKKYQADAEALWQESMKLINAEFNRAASPGKAVQVEFILLNIIVADNRKNDHDLFFSFDVLQDRTGFYGVKIFKGKVVGFERSGYAPIDNDSDDD